MTNARDAGTSLMSLIKEDWEACGKDWSKPGFRAIAVYRYGVWLRHQRRLFRRPLSWLYVRLHRYVRNHYGIEIGQWAKIGRRLSIAHQHGVTIHHKAVIGDDCHLSHMVTIGAISKEKNEPVLGDRVTVGVGARILGNVTVGDDAQVGANAVVTMDVPAGATVFGNPARILPGSAKEPARDRATSDRDTTVNGNPS